MSKAARDLRITTEHTVQTAAVFLLLFAAIAALVATLGAAFKLWSWVEFPLGWNGEVLQWGGMAVQIGLTALLCLFSLILPTALRVLSLERSHRDFSITMSDVAEAYHLCHAVDRQGVFTLSHEYDAVRERIEHLRQHPALETLEPAVLTAAAQMSTVSHDLAEIYSDEAIARSRSFLEERQHELERFRARIDEVTATSNDLRRWLEAVELEESIAESQLKQVEEQLNETMEKLGHIREERESSDQASEPARLRSAAE